MLTCYYKVRNKLSSSEADAVRTGARSRNRSLKKSPAVQDDDPTTHHHQHHPHQQTNHLFQHQQFAQNLLSQHNQVTTTHHHSMQHLHNASSLQHHLTLPSSSSMAPEPRRAASFDVSASQKLSPAPFRVGSFDTGRSAFSPVEVPRLLVQSPLSPLQLEPPPVATDSRLLTVPSPSDFRKSPVSCESPKSGTGQPATSMDILNSLSLNPGLISQLTAAISRPVGVTSPLLDDMKLNFGTVPKIEQMDCSGGSFETANSGSFDMNMMSAHSSFDQGTAGINIATPEILATMPPKSVIQDDIRGGSGRFSLVRKRGRSEVWNLFGQVLDGATQLRLPYVACYACKVLYTDTGGGTGNMTRHRCPIGASYRSSTHASSTETVEARGTDSFDSTMSARNFGVDGVKNQLSISMGGESTSGSAQSGSGNSSLPLLTQHSGEEFQNTIGDVDREVLIDAVVKCCAVDLIDPIVFSGKGFRGLLKQISHVSKRLGPAVSPPVEAFPDIQTVRNAMQTHLRFCADDLKNELSRTPQGCRLALETLTYSGRDYRVIHGSRISPDWKWRSNILGVFKARENESLSEMINIVVHNYELNKNILRVTVPNANNDLEKSYRSYFDIKAKLKEVRQIKFFECIKSKTKGKIDTKFYKVLETGKSQISFFLQILFQILSTCSQPVMEMLTAVDQLTKALVDADIRLPFVVEPREDIFDVHQLLAEWNDQWGQLEQIISTKCADTLLESFKKLDPVHMRDLEIFILPFRETVESLTSEHPNFHKVLPEWLALQHECQLQNDEPTALLRELKQIASRILEAEKELIMTDEHMIAVLLNPRLIRKLSMILTDQERAIACEKIRSQCGFRNPKEPLSRGSSCDGEPHRKRRMFLSSLEDDQVTDELECYLRSQYPPNQTKDVITFWSTTGHTQFPMLSSMARRVLCTPAVAPVTQFDARCASVSPDQLHTFLMLRSMFDSEKDEEPSL
ncbi:Protein CBG13700 [Caenorhabditis briggsae]|uniref:Protein CBG13700 n=1 Tax=Caenorhabditis briggsae TaxID=6238 RepID=A8XII1_CAEBR|nr:Protein CBG13700 [Caenorhabditis briggsae]CAP32455.2 Protein CBG13700 [Caenorhabditis briggsae]